MPPVDQTAPPSGSGRRNLILAAGAAVLVVAAIVVASLVFRGGDDEATETTGTATTPSEIGALFEGIPQDRAVLGSPDATVTMIQFEDLQCPVCKRYQEEGLPGIVEEYVRPGKLKLRFAGLAFIGPDSEKALLHVIAAGEQGKLWQYADELYANQGAENSGWVTDALLKRVAGDLGLDFAKLQKDADGKPVLDQANAMATEASERQVPGTPWFYIQIGDGEPYEVRPSSFAIEEFRQILDDALAG
jgi:protein-disulfide isomerase